MRLFSVQNLIQTTKQVILRFPITILSAAMATGIALYLIEQEDNGIDHLFPLLNALLCFALGIPLFFGVKMLSATSKKSPHILSIGYTIVVLLLIALYFYLPDSNATLNPNIPYTRYGIYNAIGHLTVAFAPFLLRNQLNGFWNYNKTLFIRIATSALYSFVLYVGLTIALTALHKLFGIDIEGRRYFQLFVLITGLFNTLVFLAGIPKNINDLESITTYPKPLRIFAQYILTPLLLLYLVILYGYGIKVLITGILPKGIVAYLISGISVFGIFTLLLLYPFQFQKDRKWVKTLSSWYYYLLIPLILLLFVAIGLRIASYGVTVNRYVILVLGIWLFIIAGYFSIGKKNIKIIPMLLAIFLGLVSFGPWGMFQVSENSQVKRLYTLLNEHGLLKESKVQNEVYWVADSLPRLHTVTPNTNHDILPDSIHNEVKSILDYLDEYHGFSAIQGWYNQPLHDFARIVKDSNKYVNESKLFMESLGLPYRSLSNKERTQTTHFTTKNNKELSVKNYELVVLQNRIHRNQHCKRPLSLTINQETYELLMDSVSQDLSLTSQQDSFIIHLDTLQKKLIQLHGLSKDKIIPAKDAQIIVRSDRYQLLFAPYSIDVYHRQDSSYINSIGFNLLVRTLN